MLDEDTPVFISGGKDSNVIPGRVIEHASDQSYLVDTPTGMSRRNRSYLNVRTDGQTDAPAICKRVFLEEPQLLQGCGLELSSNLQTNLHSRQGDVV